MLNQILDIFTQAATVYAIGLFSFIAVVVFAVTVFAHFIVGHMRAEW